MKRNTLFFSDDVRLNGNDALVHKKWALAHLLAINRFRFSTVLLKLRGNNFIFNAANISRALTKLRRNLFHVREVESIGLILAFCSIVYGCSNNTQFCIFLFL